MSEQPSMLGAYPVERELGRGGMGVVYLARDPRLNRPVAAFDLRKLRLGQREWDIMPDGRLLAVQNGEGEDDIAFNVVLNWFDEVRTKMGAK
jgi:hypothetical protein